LNFHGRAGREPLMINNLGAGCIENPHGKRLLRMHMPDS
jgi:hypothetical protein